MPEAHGEIMIENYYIPNNPAVKRAKELYNKIIAKRHEKEELLEEAKKRWPEMLHCTKMYETKKLHGISGRNNVAYTAKIEK